MQHQHGALTAHAQVGLEEESIDQVIVGPQCKKTITDAQIKVPHWLAPDKLYPFHIVLLWVCYRQC